MMRRACSSALACALLLFGCNRKHESASALHPTVYGAAIVHVSGEKQAVPIGTDLPQPLVVQVNDAQGNAVPGALVEFQGSSGSSLDPAAVLTDSSGQATTAVTLGSASGLNTLTATTRSSTGKPLEVKVTEIALGYQQNLGRVLSDRYCARCHDSESTPERVSNFDNLSPAPHTFTDGETYNKLSDADLTALIGHGGSSQGRSPEMPPFAYTLRPSDLQALIAYIRAVSDPPYHPHGLVYAK